MSMKNVSLLLVSFFLTYTTIFAQTINLDLDAKNLKKTHKLLLIYLHKTGCPYCERLEEFTFDDGDVEEYMKEYFVFRSFNVSEVNNRVVYNGTTMTNSAFSAKFGYGFFPVVIFMDSDKNIIDTSLGYVEEDIFLAKLHYLTSGIYESIDFETYQKQIMK